MKNTDTSKEAFAKRLHEVLDDLDYAKRGRAQRIKREGDFDLSDRAINKWLSAESMPEHHNIEKLCKLYNVNFNWLAAGQGVKHTKPSIADLRSQMDAIVNKKTSSEMPSSDFKIAKAISSDKTPVISWVAAGSWTEVDSVTLDDVIETIPKLDHLSDRQFGLKIQGRSMLPKFKPGDIIYVEPEITPWELRDGDLIVVQCNDGKSATFKQLVIGETADDMYLRPLNPDWPEQRLVPMGECELVGIADTKIEALRTRLR